MTRLDTTYGYKWWILLGSVVVTIIVFISFYWQKATFTAEARVQVQLLQSATSGEQNALAANELAAQYSQLATGQPVLKRANQILTGVKLHPADVSAQPINNYNIIQISVTGVNSHSVKLEASAAAKALVSYISHLRQQVINSAARSANTQITKLDRQISELEQQIVRETRLSRGSSAAARKVATLIPSDRSLLASLVNTRTGTFTGPQQQFLQSQPNVSVLDRPDNAVANPRRVVVYSVAAFVITFIVLIELLYLLQKVRLSSARLIPPPHQRAVSVEE